MTHTPVDTSRNRLAAPHTNGKAPHTPPEPIAMIGIACRFPGGVTDPESYWKLLCDGIDAIREVPADRWDINKFYDPEPGKLGKIITKWGGFLEEVDQFDAAFFGISPREAASMDPQQRWVLESTWDALEDAGQRIEDLAGTNVGVFVGVSTFDYGLMQSTYTDVTSAGPYTNTGQALSIVANRLSYTMNFKGPSTIVDTACSSSLLACHFAAESIWRGESRIAVVAGVNFVCTPSTYIGFSAMGMLSPEGRCKAFDASASGFVRSEGIGTIILKPLSQALADGDKIYALLRGTASNQDGRTPGMTVPSQSSQEALVRAACARAGIRPSQIRYLEAHGTGTLVGDPIEARALGAALGEGRGADEPCIMGSVKSNIGHLEAGSGIAGLIKAALVLQHETIPPNIHFNTPNPDIDFAGLRLEVPTALRPLPGGEGPAYAGVNSFGFGGTNVHAIIEGPPRVSAPETVVPLREEDLAQFVPLSARSPESLRLMAKSYADALAADGLWAEATLHDIASTCVRRRSHHDHRMAVIAHSKEELRERLEIVAAGELDPFVIQDRAALGLRTPLAFVFSGQGPQWWAMGRELLEQEPVFRAMVERCDAIMSELGGWSLIAELTAEEGESRIQDTAFAQPAIFALQVGLLSLWESWGIRPDIVVGHSVGEVAAAYAAGALSLEDAVRTIFHRGRVMATVTASGRMLAAGITPAEAEELIAPFEGLVGIAAVNAPGSVTLSGDAETLEAIDQQLKERNVFSRFLQVSHAFHSFQMDPVEGELRECLADLEPRTAGLPIISTVTGQALEGGELTADYWWRNVRQSVRFAEAMSTLADRDFAVIVEVSPHPVLAGSIAECFAAKGKKARVVASLRRAEPERAVVLRALGTLYTLGCALDWEGVAPVGRFIDLPRYPWVKESFWHESMDSREARLAWDGHRILGCKLRTTAKPTWQGFFDTRIQEFVVDHQIQGHVLMPGTGFAEIALALGKELHGAGNYVVSDLRLLKAAFMPEKLTSVVHTVLDPQTGRFTIMSQSFGAPGRPWTTHAVGTIRERAPVKPRFNPTLEEARAECDRVLPPDGFYQFAARCGFPFGPRFRTGTKMFLGRRAMLAQVELPEFMDEEWEYYIFHPAVLDACLQPNFGCFLTWNRSAQDFDPLAESGVGAEIFMPSCYQEIRLYKPPQKKMWAFVRMNERLRDHSDSDVFIYDDDGDLIAEVRGFEETMVGNTGGTIDRYDDLLYEYEWQFQPRDGAAVNSVEMTDPEAVAAAMTADSEAEGTEVTEAERNVVETTARAAAALAFEALERLGLKLEPGATIDLDACAAELGVVETRTAALQGLFAAIVEEGALTRGESGSLVVARRPLDLDPRGSLRRIVAEHPRHYARVALLDRCALVLPEILRGEIDPNAVLFPNGALDLIDHVQAESRDRQRDLSFAADTVAKLLADGPEGRVLRVLELQGGSGAFAAAILPRLPLDRTSYVFTDASDQHFARAQEALGDFDCVCFQALDLAADPIEQAFPEHGFDLVIGGNGQFGGADPAAALANVAGLLTAEGVLLLVEPVAIDPVTALTFALGFDAATPMRTPSEWEETLGASGYRSIAAVPGPLAASGASSVLLMARAPEQPAAAVEVEPLFSEPGTWLVFADTTGTGDRLTDLLRQAGEEVLMVRASDAYAASADGAYHINPECLDDWQALFTAIKATHPALRGHVYLWALDIPAPDGSEDFARTFEPARTLGSLALVNFTRGWTAINGMEPSQIWLVSRHAQPIGETPCAVEQAPLWGMGRVVINEFGHLNVRMADLGSTSDHELSQLRDEMAAALPEDEVAFREDARYVHRFVSSSLERYARRMGQAGEPYRLCLSDFGVLDQMRLRPFPLRRPLDAPTLIELEVKAAALNFSDVMKALGLYPGLQIGPVPVGIECAGIVTAVGEAVTEFQVGDEVVCISPVSLASHAYTDHRLCAHKPASITFSEAATLPIAFLTAQYALDYVGRMEAGERVLIHAATGGVGLAAIQLAQRAGAEIFATAGTPEKRALLEFMGVKREQIMDSRTLTFAEEVLEKTRGRGVDLVLNSLAGEAIAKGMGVLADYGRFLEIGKRDIYANSPLGMKAFRKNVTFAAIDLDRGLREKPELCGDMFKKLVSEVAEGRLTPLPYRAFSIHQVIDAFRYMAKAKHTGKVIVTMDGAAITPVRDPAEAFTKFRAESTYLITGGLGGFGIPTAQWMAENGARTLVLVGRRGVYNAEAQEAIDTMIRRGCRVVVETADVSDPEQVKALLERVQAELPPLKGIVHAAVTLDDGLIMNLDRERIDRVAGAKLNGAWYLHHYTKETPLDFFVCYSSTSAVFGNPGQGNYSAANLFLDSLAQHRRALGLPALTINWGYLGEIGVAAGNAKLAERFEAQGVKAVPPAEGLPLLGKLMACGVNQIAVMRMDWNRMRNLGLGVALSPRFSTLVKTVEGVTEGGQKADGAAIRKTLLAAAPEQRRAILLNIVLEKVARVLGTSTARIEVDKPLMDLGLDSLMGVELRNWIEGELRVNLPVVELMQGPTVQRLADLLLQQLEKEEGEGGAAAAAMPSFAPATTDPAALQRIAEYREAIQLGSQIAAELQVDMRVDLRNEAILPAAIQPVHSVVNFMVAPRTAFMTGSTGFLGAYLLSDLLDQTTADYLCLVRAESAAEGHAKIVANLQRHGRWNPDWSERVTPILGDLAQPMLGLSEAEHDDLARRVEVIYHNGAAVQFVYPYQTLKPVNVDGTIEMIKLAFKHRVKVFHYVSTLAIFSLMDHLERGTVTECDVPKYPEFSYSGYIQSKWVADSLVRAARERGLPASIYRPAIITGDSKTGIGGTDVLMRTLQASIQVGALVPGLSKMSYTPVDYVAAAITAISRQSHGLMKDYHLINPSEAAWSSVIDWLRDYGYELEPVTYDEWRARLKRQSEISRDNALYGLLPLMPELQLAAAASRETDEQTLDLAFDCAQAEQLLKPTGVTCPPMDQALVHRYLDYFVESGLCPSPNAQRQPSSVSNAAN